MDSERSLNKIRNSAIIELRLLAFKVISLLNHLCFFLLGDKYLNAAHSFCQQWKQLNKSLFLFALLVWLPIYIRFLFYLNTKLSLRNSPNDFFFDTQWYLLPGKSSFSQGCKFYFSTQKERSNKSTQNLTIKDWRCKTPLFFSNIYLWYIRKKTLNKSNRIIVHKVINTLYVFQIQ